MTDPQPDQITRSPTFRSAAVYSLIAGGNIMGVVAFLGDLLEGHGSGLVLGVQAGAFVALAVVAREMAEPVLGWMREPFRGGDRRAA